MNIKICTKCKESKIINKFSKNKNMKDGLHIWCRDCVKEYDQLNKEKQANYHRLKRINEIENFKAYDKKYKSENRDKQNKYNSEKWKNNPTFKLRKILRGRFWDALKRHTSGGKVNKFHSSLALLGCSIEEFKIYLESMFLPQFTWENHGIVWEIDHIEACAKFDLTKFEEQQKCFNYKNLQPLFKTTEIAESFGYTGYIGNREKGNK